MPTSSRVWDVRCDQCGHTAHKKAKSERSVRQYMRRLGWYLLDDGRAYCPVCKMHYQPAPPDNPRTKPLHEFPGTGIKEGDFPRGWAKHPERAVRRTVDPEKYRTAIGEEYRAVALYNDMISQSKDEGEGELLRHIRDEEVEHLDELKGASRINPAVHCPRCEAVIVTDFLSKYIIKRGWYMCPQCRYQIKVNPVKKYYGPFVEAVDGTQYPCSEDEHRIIMFGRDMANKPYSEAEQKAVWERVKQRPPIENPARDVPLVDLRQSVQLILDHYLYDEIRDFEEWWEDGADPGKHILWHILQLVEWVDPAKAAEIRAEVERDIGKPVFASTNPVETEPLYTPQKWKHWSTRDPMPSEEATLEGHDGDTMGVCAECGVGIWHDPWLLADDIFTETYEVRCPKCGWINEWGPEQYEP